MANNLNQFFTSVGSNTVTKIKSLAKESNYTPSQLPFVPRSYPESEQFTFGPVECSLVEHIVQSMPDNKAPGIDKIPIHGVIKDCLPIISPWITSIINNSLVNSILPSTWKIAEVIPIPKEGDHELAKNNRPSSLLPVLSKECERVALCNRPLKCLRNAVFHACKYKVNFSHMFPTLHCNSLLNSGVT